MELHRILFIKIFSTLNCSSHLLFHFIINRKREPESNLSILLLFVLYGN